MPMLTPTDHHGTITWLGVVLDRAVTLRSEPRDRLDFGFAGAPEECHGGLTRPSCSRVKLQYERGTEIANARQLSLLSKEELGDVAAEMGIPGIAPEWTGANVILSGIPDFSSIPPSSRLIFESGASVAIDMANGPCRFVAEEIEKEHPGRGLPFPTVARDRRGVTARVERPGAVEIGMRARLHIPVQKSWAHGTGRATAQS
ncbi:MAG: MOSC domain-containing protein [Pikeienuella sp.]|uniref:MOSC domain-containing protein n=1 Tax=Pikeienuella sp. TaxID=2831957 RepID=UPI00391D7B6B